MNVYGIIGQSLTHSLSPAYFKERFIRENLSDSVYMAFEIKNISELPELISANQNLKGFNITIPYKQKIIPFLDKITEPAKSISAVNTVVVLRNRKSKPYLIGYNTDVIGFEKSLFPILKTRTIKNAFIIGTGGSSKAVAFVLKKNNIPFAFISRNPKEKNEIHADQLDKNLINDHELVINCTPLGMLPNVNALPPFNYSLVTRHHFFYDLVYNPAETAFMKMGKKKGVSVKNGFEMLTLQAEASWEIWKEQINFQP